MLLYKTLKCQLIRAKAYREIILLFLTVIFAIGFTGFLLISDITQESNLEKTKIAGDKIIRAIRDYHERQGRYPKTLDSLVPEFIDSIPSPKWGLRRWRYVVKENYFELSVSANKGDYPILFYDTEWEEWYYDD